MLADWLVGWLAGMVINEILALANMFHMFLLLLLLFSNDFYCTLWHTSNPVFVSLSVCVCGYMFSCMLNAFIPFRRRRYFYSLKLESIYTAAVCVWSLMHTNHWYEIDNILCSCQFPSIPRPFSCFFALFSQHCNVSMVQSIICIEFFCIFFYLFVSIVKRIHADLYNT